MNHDEKSLDGSGRPSLFCINKILSLPTQSCGFVSPEEADGLSMCIPLSTISQNPDSSRLLLHASRRKRRHDQTRGIQRDVLRLLIRRSPTHVDEILFFYLGHQTGMPDMTACMEIHSSCGTY